MPPAKITECERASRKKARDLYTLLVGGLTDEEARDVLGLQERGYESLKKKMFEFEAERLHSHTTEKVYLEYVIHQMSCISDLCDLQRRLEAQKKTSALVGVVRARSDIYDKVIKYGQEFGILEKRPEEKRIIAGVVVAQLSDEELRQAIATELTGISNLVERYGEKNILDVNPGRLHYALSEGKPQDKTNRARSGRNHGGRKLVKEKLV